MADPEIIVDYYSTVYLREKIAKNLDIACFDQRLGMISITKRT